MQWLISAKTLGENSPDILAEVETMGFPNFMHSVRVKSFFGILKAADPSGASSNGETPRGDS